MLSPEDITDPHGIPLPLIGPQEAYESSRRPNKHHPEHPDAASELQGFVGRVVRHSRVQITPVPTHDYYHELGLSPVLPVNEDEQFVTTVLNHTDYLPQKVLDLSNRNNPHVRPLRKSDLVKIKVKPEMGKLGEDGQCNNRRNTGQFLANYVIKQDVDHEQGIVDRFLDTDSADLKLQLGWQLIRTSVRAAVKPINPIFEAARDSERLGTSRLGEVYGMHLRPHPFNVVVAIFTKEYLPDYIEPLERRLRQSA